MNSKKFRIGLFWAVWQKWAIFNPHFWTEAAIFFHRAWELKIVILQKIIARAVFESLFFLQKQLIYDFFAGTNYTDSPHSQGGMKFATQI